MSTSLQPFQNESQSTAIDELTIENRLDQIEMYGSLAITRDQAGLQKLRELKAVVDATLAALEAATDLPEHIDLRPSDKIDNPFK
jgi:hypothetical protein